MLKARLKKFKDRLSSKDDGFVIIVGEFGLIFALMKEQKILDKILFKGYNDEVKSDLKQRLKKFPILPVSIILDTVEQSYKKKEYPFINKRDLMHLVKRDQRLEAKNNNDAFTNHFQISNSANKKKSKKEKKWEYLFASALTSEVIRDSVDFVNESPNRLTGIYMMPIESTALFKALKPTIKQKSQLKDKFSDIYCLVTQSKVSKLRQTIFFEDQVVFTRLLDYNCDDEGFAERYEPDLVATSQYLKRLFPEVNLHELEAVNILPKEALDKISDAKNPDLHFINMTPFEAEKAISRKSSLTQNAKDCDLLLMKSFCRARKKFLRFTTPRIQFVEKMFWTMRASYFANLFSLMMIAVLCLMTISKINNSQEALSQIDALKLETIKTLNVISSRALDGEVIIDSETNEEVGADKILDLSKIHEGFEPYYDAFFENYYKLRFLRDNPVSLKYYNFHLNDLSAKSSRAKNFILSIKGKVNNESGDIEDLFAEFDGVISQFKKNYKGAKVTHNELPRNIDFTKQYFDYAIEFSIESKI